MHTQSFIFLSFQYLFNRLLDFLFQFLLSLSSLCTVQGAAVAWYIYKFSNFNYYNTQQRSTLLAFYTVSCMTWHNIFIRSFHQVCCCYKMNGMKKTTRKRRRLKSLESVRLLFLTHIQQKENKQVQWCLYVWSQ